MSNMLLGIVTTASLLLALGVAEAHHGYAAFDTKAEVTIEATVR